MSVSHRNNCVIACSNHTAVQLISLESFACTHKEIYFRVTIDDERFFNSLQRML